MCTDMEDYVRRRRVVGVKASGIPSGFALERVDEDTREGSGHGEVAESIRYSHEFSWNTKASSFSTGAAVQSTKLIGGGRFRTAFPER